MSGSGSGAHNCGLTAGGAAYCWGDNTDGQLGDGTTTGSSTPVSVSGGLTFAQVSAGGDHSCGVTTGGAAYCWGRSLYGELGNGTESSPETCPGGPCHTTPVPVLGALSLVQVSAGKLYTCALTSGGQAYCWGFNAYGQLGDGTATSRLVPVAVVQAVP
jgi:alpha-tubulin suppressor-like RCC1 family protein